jgi:DNA polymerase-4
VAWDLCQQAAGAAPLRLVGVRAEGLVPAGAAARQPAIGEREHGWREAERASDAVAARFGLGTVRPASLLGQSGERAAGPDENAHVPDKSLRDVGVDGRDAPV